VPKKHLGSPIIVHGLRLRRDQDKQLSSGARYGANIGFASRVRETVSRISLALSKLPTRFEIIVVDDGSTDGTRAAAELSDAVVLSSAENGGDAAWSTLPLSLRAFEAHVVED